MNIGRRKFSIGGWKNGLSRVGGALLFVILASGITLSRKAEGQTPPQYGPVTLDGVLNPSEWSSVERLDLPPWQAPAGTELYGKFVGNAYVLGIKSASVGAGAFGTIWVNSDN